MRGGVRRILGDASAIEAELVRRGWTVGVVPPATSDDELWRGVETALALPAWFGRNLDALDECLNDLPRPTALVLASWTSYARARPERWGRLLTVLTDWADRRDAPAFLVVLAD